MPKSVWTRAFEVYLGPGSKDGSYREEAHKVAADIIQRKEFELQKETIQRIDYKAPGFLHHGHVIFRASSGDYSVGINMKQSNFSIYRPLTWLVPSLILFADDRFYDEETGLLVRDEVLKKHAEKHWWA